MGFDLACCHLFAHFYVSLASWDFQSPFSSPMLVWPFSFFCLVSLPCSILILLPFFLSMGSCPKREPCWVSFDSSWDYAAVKLCPLPSLQSSFCPYHSSKTACQSGLCTNSLCQIQSFSGLFLIYQKQLKPWSTSTLKSICPN